MSRYNGQQPYGYYGGHDGYNPANDGWTHTGSNAQSKADFYERDNVKMDYYPSTGTVKTSMEHPSQGPTQMFRRDLDSASFGNVCNNPRAHTGNMCCKGCSLAEPKQKPPGTKPNLATTTQANEGLFPWFVHKSGRFVPL